MAISAKPYAEARARYLKGHNLKEIAADLGIPYEGLAKQCKRKGWDNLRSTVGLEVSKAVQADFRGKAGAWLAQVDAFVNAGMARLQPASMTLKDLALAVGIADTCDRMARRAYGMDEDKGQRPASLTINMAVTASTDAAPLGKVIDVDGVVVTDATDTAPKQIS